jgi:hypothetical protein
MHPDCKHEACAGAWPAQHGASWPRVPPKGLQEETAWRHKPGTNVWVPNACCVLPSALLNSLLAGWPVQAEAEEPAGGRGVPAGGAAAAAVPS